MTYERNDYTKGSRWRVVRAGAQLWGWEPIAGGFQGWGRDLVVGRILTCAGSSMTSGDGVPAIKWLDEKGAMLAVDCCFKPVKGGMWGGQVPEDGFLERIEATAEAEAAR